MFRVLVAIGLMALLAGCEQARSSFGLAKSSPDEFAVVTRAPLAIPPEFGLRPPTPGAKRPQEASTRSEARDILLRSRPTEGGKNFSRGELALLGKAGTAKADPAIRQKVSRESSILAESDDTFMKRLMFWQEEELPGSVIDAKKESRRLEENASLNDPVVKGTTPVIERREKGFLEGIFN